VLCALGDLLLDVIVRLDGSIAEDTDTYGRTRVGAGGQAANVAAWTAALGREARFVGKRARDPIGRLVADELRRHGVEVVGPEVAVGTGTVVSIATADGKRTMLTDRGVALDFRPGELDPDWLAGCERLHIPGYSLFRPPVRDTALAAAELARGAGIELSVDLSSTSADEAALVGELEVETVVVKRGARGCVVRRAGEERVYRAEPAEVVETTGAGDAFAAGFLADGPELALRTAARCVAQMGAMP
jgi:sugar/nucleoside kinase (ribokinase family)